MPTLPRALPQGQTSVTRLNTSAAGSGLAALAGGVDAITEAVDAKDAYRASRAEVDFLAHISEGVRQFDDDSDYGTFDTRFTKDSTDRRNKLAENIKNPQRRQAFIDGTELRLQGARQNVQDQALSKEKDTERRAVEDSVRTIRETAIAGGDIVTSMAAITNQYNAAADAGYFSQEEVGSAIEATQHDFAEGYLRSLPVAERAEALKSKWAQLLPTDTRAVLEREARDGLREAQSLDFVDDLMNQGFTPEDVRTGVYFEAIEDPDLRTETERRFYTEYARKKNLRADEVTGNYNDLYQQVVMQGTSVKDLPEEAITDLMFSDGGPALYQGLKAAEANFVADNDPVTSQSVIDELYVLQAKGKLREAREVLMTAAADGSVSRRDYDQWSKVTAQAEAPVEVKGLFTATQRLKDLIPASASDAIHTSVRNNLSDWYTTFQEQSGKLPSDSEVDEEIHRLTRKLEFSGWFNDELVTEVLDDVELKGSFNSADVQYMTDLFIQERGKAPTPTQLRNLLKQAKGLSQSGR